MVRQDRVIGNPDRDYLYGRNGILEALRGKRVVHELLMSEGVKEDDRIREILKAASERGITAMRVPREMLDDLTLGANHQGLVLNADPYEYAELGEVIDRGGTVLMLDHLQDPQNLGTLFRAAEAAGVAGIIIPRERAVGITPSVVNASAGAVEHMLIVQAPSFGHAVQALKGAGWWIAGLDSGEGAQDIFSGTIPTPIALIVGAEGAGLGSQLRKSCDLVLELPMLGKVASLNAATAGSIALFELLRRTRAAG